MLSVTSSTSRFGSVSVQQSSRNMMMEEFSNSFNENDFLDDEPLVVVESGEDSRPDLISQQQCPATLILYLKDSRNRDVVVQRQIIQDLIIMNDFEGLMKRIALLFESFPNQHNLDKISTLSVVMQIVCRVGSCKKQALTNDSEWRDALQRLLQSNCTCMELFVKLKYHKQKPKNASSYVTRALVPSYHQKTHSLLDNHMFYQKKRPIRSLFKLDSFDFNASSFDRIIVDATSMMLAVKELKHLLLYKNRKEQAERFILKLFSHLHHVNSLKLMHICFNSTSNLVIPENQRDIDADTFVVSVAPAFSFVNEQVVESANRQIIAGYLESCLVVTNDCVLTKEMKNMGVKCCTPKSFLKQSFKAFSRSNKEMNVSKKSSFREWISSHVDIPMFH
ncbi:hypothetical protein FDP41_009120 [Naegleria fowleri]|uniref:Uncharacterized protein n=1 Tax=Naegleria fowleri TaxID=5763 RepID=A0A6A5BED8_NAEFO|nr:uncharacterized protein FDP41_009120 [Naegleria fowleri]KAF0972871.1 hypothetical protein FDP41_009120 [Naegleria fowleri]